MTPTKEQIEAAAKEYGKSDWLGVNAFITGAEWALQQDRELLIEFAEWAEYHAAHKTPEKQVDEFLKQKKSLKQ